MVTLYKYFASIGKIDSGPVHNFPSLVDDEKCMRDVTVTESDVLRAICKMKANASSEAQKFANHLLEVQLTV